MVVFGIAAINTIGVNWRSLFPLISIGIWSLLYWMYASRIFRAHASVAMQDIVGTFALVLLIFLPALAHINFVQYFYCKKYEILCDENGDTTSPNLERKRKAKKIKVNSKTQKNIDAPNDIPSKRKIPMIIKILIGIVSVPILFFIVVFIVFFIKGFIQGIT